MLSDFAIELDKFNVSSLIGEGEFGSVYLIENKETKELFAAKVNKEKCARKPEKKAFKKEIIAYSKINCLSILRLFGYSHNDFKSKSYPTKIFKYTQNGSLQDIFHKIQQSQAPSKWTDTTRYIVLLGTAIAMSHLHSLCIMHKDLKPSNILLDENYYPQVSDFVLTKYSEKQLAKIFMKKTIENYYYVAPEINIGKPFTSKADVYSFAMIAYELITFKRSPIEISAIPGESNQVFFKKCLSKDPTDRFSFSEICKFIIRKSFMKVFNNNIDYDAVNVFLDLFEEDSTVMFLHGALLDETQTDKKEISARYYKLSADKGNDKAMNNYAYMLKHGEGVEANKKEAIFYYKKAIEKGNSRAMYNYALMLEHGDGIDVNKEEAARYYKMSADKGNDKAMCNYAFMLEHGDGVSANVKEAIKYYRMAIYKGNDKAMNNYALLLKHGDFVQANKEAAIYYYKLAIDRGNQDAMYNYALMLENGDGVEVNKEKAARYYKMAADKGNDNAMYNYAFMLERGEGINANKKEAAYYYKLAAEKGNMFAMNNYAKMKENGDGISVGKEEAAHFYQLSADKGNPVAMKNYASMLERGDGVKMDKEKAARYYKKAIDKGNEYAMNHYASMLQKGDGIEINKKEAAYYYKMSADKGNSVAMKNYAKMLESGDGIDVNKEEAAKYYRMSDEKEKS